MRAFCQHARKRFEPTHGDVLNLHTGRREGGGWGTGFSFLSLVPSLFLSSFFFLSSVILFLRSLSLSLLFSLSKNDNDQSSSRALSQYTRACLALWARVHVPWHTVWRTCSHHARNNCLNIPVQASCHLE